MASEDKHILSLKTKTKPFQLSVLNRPVSELVPANVSQRNSSDVPPDFPSHSALVSKSFS